MSNIVRLILTVSGAACVAVLVRGFVLPEPEPVVEYVEKVVEVPAAPRKSPGLFGSVEDAQEVEPLCVTAKYRINDVWTVWLSDGRRLRTDRPAFDGLEEIGPDWVRVDGETLKLRRL